jgi:dGTPase
LRAGLFEVTDVRDLPLVGDAYTEVVTRHPGVETGRLIHTMVSAMIGAMVSDLLAETRRRLAATRVDSADAIRALDGPVVAFSGELQTADRAVKAFLFERMYRHHRVNRMTSKARRVVTELFDLLFAEPELLPGDWRRRSENRDETRRARVVADYIAGMTDRYALDLHRKLFDPEALQTA